jgi:hypothetical protein
MVCILIQFLTTIGIWQASPEIEPALVKLVLFCAEKNADLINKKGEGLFTGTEKICFFPGSRKNHVLTAEDTWATWQSPPWCGPAINLYSPYGVTWNLQLKGILGFRFAHLPCQEDSPVKNGNNK